MTAKSLLTFVGIDGIPGGWVAVYLCSDGNQRFSCAKRAADLLSVPSDRAMIDMPLGLPARGCHPVQRHGTVVDFETAEFPRWS